MDRSGTRIGWIGTGVMGSSMCGHLLAAGHPVSVTTRTRAKAGALLDAGATWADSPAAVAATSDVVFVMVGYPGEVEEVVLGDARSSDGSSGGVLGALAPGGLVVDMTTSRPALAVEIAERASALGVGALDAPVSGGDVGARNGTLSIMVGGDAEAFARARQYLDVMGATVVHQGPAGAGQHTKLANQVLVAGNIVAVCEALLYATRAGLDVESVLASVSGGAAASWALTNLAPRIVAGDYAPGFFVDHFVKDMAIVLEEAARLQLALPGLALAHQLYVALQAQGHGRDGTQSLILALASLSPVG
ncbi:MAG TPA: NAD(P)-dependent oxidoreductase [Acidimicrobiia bacterium]|nr:NAD(P)-dependent oxidoreductase [Acidimicrobiia bacterium]